MKLIDSGYLVLSSYPHDGRERYDLNNGNSYLSEATGVSYGVNQGANIKIYEQENGRLVADWGNIPLMGVIRFTK